MEKKPFLVLSLFTALFLTLGGFFLWRGGLISPSRQGNSETGQALGARSEVESRVPSDIPLYPSATAKSFNETLEATQIVWETSDGAALVNAFYRNEMEKYGWQRTENLTFKKENGRQADIQILAESNGQTYFSLNLNRPHP